MARVEAVVAVADREQQAKTCQNSLSFAVGFCPAYVSDLT